MQQFESVSGFSELKQLLIETYRIERPFEEIRLYFTLSNDDLVMHDYDKHQNSIVVFDGVTHEISKRVIGKARKLCEEAVRSMSPADFLNEGFKLYGFYRS